MWLLNKQGSNKVICNAKTFSSGDHLNCFDSVYLNAGVFWDKECHTIRPRNSKNKNTLIFVLAKLRGVMDRSTFHVRDRSACLSPVCSHVFRCLLAFLIASNAEAKSIFFLRSQVVQLIMTLVNDQNAHTCHRFSPVKTFWWSASFRIG